MSLAGSYTDAELKTIRARVEKLLAYYKEPEEHPEIRIQCSLCYAGFERDKCRMCYWNYNRRHNRTRACVEYDEGIVWKRSNIEINVPFRKLRIIQLKHFLEETK